MRNELKLFDVFSSEPELAKDMVCKYLASNGTCFDDKRLSVKKQILKELFHFCGHFYKDDIATQEFRDYYRLHMIFGW